MFPGSAATTFSRIAVAPAKSPAPIFAPAAAICLSELWRSLGRNECGSQKQDQDDYQILAHSLPPRSHLLRMAAKRVFREKIGAHGSRSEHAASRPNIGPHERLLWSNPSIALGSFDSSPDDEDFETAGEIGDRPAIAFSRTAVGIAHAKRAPVVSDGTVAVLHNPRYPYRRFRVDARGDHSEWLSIDAELLLGLNRRLGNDPRRPFAASTAPLGRRAAALLRLVVRHLRDWSPPDPLWVEETLFDVIAALGPARRNAEAAEGVRAPRSLRAARAGDAGQPLGASVERDLDREGHGDAPRFTPAACSEAGRDTRCTDT